MHVVQAFKHVPPRCGDYFIVFRLIRWLGPLGRMWAPTIMPLHYLYWVWLCPWVLYFNTLHFVVNYAHYCMFYICGCDAQFVILIHCLWNSGLPCLVSVSVLVS